MTTVLVSHENNKAVYTTEVEWEVFSEAVDKAYHKNKGRFQIPGFRKGRVPRKIIELNYGEGVFYEDALNAVLPEAIEKAMKEIDIEPIGQPDVDVKEMEKGNSIVFEITTETMPHPELGDYTKIEVDKMEVNVTDEEVERALESERQKNAVLREIDDRMAQDGDEVTIDYVGTKGGVAFEGGSAEKQKLTLGSHSFIPGFEEQVVGHGVGEEFDISVKFPEDYAAKELAGADADFHIVLHGIAVKELPEADDEFAQDVSEFDTIEEYKNDLKKNLEESRAQQNRAMQENQAIEELVKISDVKVPEVLIEEQIDQELRNMAQQLQQMGLSMEQYISYTKANFEEMREHYRPAAESRVAGDLVLGSLVEKEKVEVTEEEIETELNRLAGLYGAQDAEDFIKRVKESGNDSLVADDLKKKKALDILMEKVQYVEPKVETELKSEEESEEK